LIEDIRLLEELQQIDSRIQDLEAQRSAIPAKLRALRENLGRIETLLAEERARLAEAEKFHGEQSSELQSEEQLIAKAKQKLQQVRNTREYMATTRELEALRKIAGERQEEVLKMMEAIEQVRASVQQHGGQLTELRAEFNREEGDSQSQITALESTLAMERRRRDEVQARVRPEILKRYRQIRLKRGLAVVAVRAGTCLGCNVNIPPQLFNILLRREALQSCPNCHRIIYVEPPAAEASKA
jgi:uncharacterized protein